MDDVVVAVIALVVGALLVLRGYATMRLAISLLGGFLGFTLGASLVAQQTGTSYLAGVPGWIGAILGALVLGGLAFSFYRAGITLGFGALGYGLSLLLLPAMGVSQTWLLQLIGLLVALALIIPAIVFDLPGIVIVLATSLAGAELVVIAMRLLTGNVVLAELSAQNPRVGLNGFWWIVVIGVALLGVVVQFRHVAVRPASSRAQWARS
ncbi:MAG: DUF4203 domain-containing protein [Propionibacterium sp.]